MSTAASEATLIIAPRVIYAGFWRRVVAAFIDSLTIGLVGFLLGLFLGEMFARMGDAGRLAGLVIAAAYLIPAYSVLMDGRTLGKRLLGLRVQGVDGNAVSLERATVRYLVLAVPLLANGVFFAQDAVPGWAVMALGVVLATVVFGGLLGNTYLLLFNLPSRRLLHDLAANTVVVRANAARAFDESMQFQAKHAIALIGLPLTVVGCLFVVGRLATGRYPQLERLQKVQIAVSARPNVVSVGVNDMHQILNGTSANVLQLTVRVASWPSDTENTALGYFVIVAKTFPDFVSRDRISVTLKSGYEIGIASKWRGSTYSHTPQEWGRLAAGGKQSTGT